MQTLTVQAVQMGNTKQRVISVRIAPMQTYVQHVQMRIPALRVKLILKSRAITSANAAIISALKLTHVLPAKQPLVMVPARIVLLIQLYALPVFLMQL